MKASDLDNDYFAQATAMMDAMQTVDDVDDYDDYDDDKSSFDSVGDRDVEEEDWEGEIDNYQFDSDNNAAEDYDATAKYWTALAMQPTSAASLEQAILNASNNTQEPGNDISSSTAILPNDATTESTTPAIVRDLAQIERQDQDRGEMEWHKSQLESQMDLTDGGGNINIGQSNHHQNHSHNHHNHHRLRRRHRRRGGRRKQTRLTPAGSRLHNLASNAFLMGDYSEALDFLQEAIQECPTAAEPYHTMGAIYEDMGNTEKALLFYMVSAHLRPKRADQWKHTAALFRQCGQMKAAIYCYTKALSADREDKEALRERCLLYIDTEQFSKSIDGLTQLLNSEPKNLLLAAELAKALVQVGRQTDAVVVHERAILANCDQSVLGGALMPDQSDFSWPLIAHSLSQSIIQLDTVNIMAELYIMNGDYQKTLEMIQSMASYLIDERRRKMPMDLRAKLGIAQIRLHDFTTARSTLESLSRQDAAAFTDLYEDVAEAWLEEHQYQDALSYFLKNADDPKNLAKMAECYRALGQYNDALTMLKKIRDMYPDFREINLQLADMYDALNDHVEARRLREVFRRRQTAAKKRGGAAGGIKRRAGGVAAKQQSLSATEESGGEQEDSGLGTCVNHRRHHNHDDLEAIKSIFLPEVSSIKSQDPTFTLGDGSSSRTNGTTLAVNNSAQQEKLKERYHENKALQHRTQYDALMADIGRMDDRAARSLVIDFQLSDKFFSHRIRRLAVFQYSTGKRKDLAGGEDGQWSGNDSSGDEEMNESEFSAQTATADQPAKFDGLTVDEWYEINRRYAMHLAIYGGQRGVEEALNILNVATRCAAFYFSPARMLQLRLYIMAIAWRTDNLDVLYSCCRWFFRRYANSPESFNLYTTVFTGSEFRAEAFANTNTTKAILRLARQNQLRNPHHMVLLGHLYAQTAYYVHSTLAYTRALQFFPNNPMIYLCLATVYLHRAMQRKTANRNLEIMRGLAFLQRYRDLRLDQPDNANVPNWMRQEVFYNIARAFHTLGLMHQAVEMYRHALAVGEVIREEKEFYDLHPDIVYNLASLYQQQGLPALTGPAIQMSHAPDAARGGGFFTEK